MQVFVELGKLLVVPIILSQLIHDSNCEGQVRKELSTEVAPDVRSFYLSSLSTTNLEALSTTDQHDLAHISAPEGVFESRQHGIKIKKKKKLKKSKKFLKKFLPFLLIPLLIQAKLIPLFLFKLKLIALKAFGIGKLALLLVAINMLYNFMHGAQDGDQQYSKEVLANENYGYNGGPELGAWINRRLYKRKLIKRATDDEVPSQHKSPQDKKL